MLLSDGDRAVLAQDGPEEDPPQKRVLAHRRYRASKSHECDGCGGLCPAHYIRKGEAYTVLILIEDREFRVMKLCDGVYGRF